jgi:transcriptional regulator with XRE-family HTH domain
VAKHALPYSAPTVLAAELLGQQVAKGRRERGWTVAELAERVGVHPVTITKIERGAPTVALGTALEAAVLCGVTLFGRDEPSLVAEVRHGRETLALLPTRVRPREEPVRDDF